VRVSLYERTMNKCKVVAEDSRDPSTKVGCVILRPNKTVAATGYNGFPRGVEDLPERYADRETKYKFTCHAEANAIVTAREDLDGYALYCTHPPCNECAKLIIQAGIIAVYTPPPSDEMKERWGDSWDITRQMFHEAGVNMPPFHD
jgi:dCMP deaminase